MAKKGGTTYMTSLERVLGGVLFVIYLVVLPVAAEPLFRLLGRLLGQSISGYAQNVICYVVLFVLCVVTFWNYIGRTTGRFLSDTLRSLAAAGMGLIAFYGLNELMYRVFRLLSADQVNLNDVVVSAQVGLAPRSTLLVVIFLAPVAEELLFRGYIFGNLRDHSRIAAYVVSCVLFAILHVWQFAMVERSFSSFLLIIRYLAPGAVLAWSYERSETLWGSILVHCVANALAVL